jgi:DNA-binding LacI/PurR family transcriptional regulator
MSRLASFHVAQNYLRIWSRLRRRIRGRDILFGIRECVRGRTPCVNACARCETPRLASVYSDNPQIGRLAAAMLWERGLRHFAFVGRPGFYHDRARGKGFEAEILARAADCAWIEVEAVADHPPP